MGNEKKIENLIKEVEGFKDMDREDQLVFHKFIVDNNLDFYISMDSHSYRKHKGWGHYDYYTTRSVKFYFKSKDGKYININRNKIPSAYYSDEISYNNLYSWSSERNKQPKISKNITNHLIEEYNYFLENIANDYSEFDI